MEFHAGTHRFVLIIDNLVFKFPRVDLLRILEEIRRHELSSLSKYILKYLLFEGFRENIQEARCYRKTKSRLLARPYLALYFVNVYQRVAGTKRVRFNSYVLHDHPLAQKDKAFRDALGNCGHSFDYPRNFAFSKGQVRILDYGEEGILPLIENHEGHLEELLLAQVKKKRKRENKPFRRRVR